MVPLTNEIDSVSPDFSDLCSQVDIQKNDQLGRHVVAAADIAADMKIGEAKPFAAVVHQTS